MFLDINYTNHNENVLQFFIVHSMITTIRILCFFFRTALKNLSPAIQNIRFIGDFYYRLDKPTSWKNISIQSDVSIAYFLRILVPWNFEKLEQTSIKEISWKRGMSLNGLFKYFVATVSINMSQCIQFSETLLPPQIEFFIVHEISRAIA